MNVKLSEEEKRKQLEIEAYDKLKEEELEEKRANDKDKRKKADKKFRLIMFSIIGVIMLVVLLKYLGLF